MILSEEWVAGTRQYLLLYHYDANGQPIGMSYRRSTDYEDTYQDFLFIKNIQGDITGIMDEEGNILVTYAYDAWGNPTSTTYSNGGASTAVIYNPFRYRGYYYDAETGLYYLNSRYYNPDIGRFINADIYINADGNIIGYNLYVYCGNSLVNYVDLFGTIRHRISNKFAYALYDEGGGTQKIVDLTEKLTEYMRQNAINLIKYKESHTMAETILYFYRNVTDGGKLDIKLKNEWKFEEGTTYLFNGIILRHDDPGNINYGYIGAVLFPEQILCMAAGANQIKNHKFKYGSIFTFFDDERDNQMIKYGYNLYRKDNDK